MAKSFMAKSSIISVLPLMPIISMFLEIDILSKKSFEGFYRLDHVYMEETSDKSKKRIVSSAN